MIGFKSDVRITSIDTSYNKDINSDITLCFNQRNSISAPKSILDLIYMLNGLFSIEHIKNTNTGHMDVDSKKVLDELLNLGVIHHSFTDFNKKYVQSKNKLCNYTTHFPKISNINIMIAVILQKMRVKSIFYENGIITQDDINRNIYYKSSDIGKNIGLFMQNEMNIDTVSFTDSIFNVDNINNDIDIVVNSDVTDWVSNGSVITINTWNYKYINFDDFKLFKGKNNRINVSDNLKPFIDEYILAIRAVDDMLYSVIGNLVF